MVQDEEDLPEWAQEDDDDEGDLPDWAREGDEDENESDDYGGSSAFDRMRDEFELDHAERRLHRPCPGCGRYPLNDQAPKEVYSAAQRSRWEDFGCRSCYAVWQCSLAVGLDVVRVSGDLVWLAAGENSEKAAHVRLYNEADKAPSLPTRVLDVSEPTPRLVHSNGLAASYAALSHSWGASQPLRTLKGNIAKHSSEGIAMGSVPLTFQDAIRVTRHLGIRYLWIDSLCITQDDGEDWAKEATRMADYYTGADVVIATSSSTGCTHGFLGARPESLGGALQIPLDEEGSSSELVPLHFREALLGDGGSIARKIGYQEDTLSSRGWCYQERLLARRYLSFGRSELIWECNTTCHCESSDVSDRNLNLLSVNTGNVGDDSDHDYNLFLRMSRLSNTDLYRFWMSKVVQHYAHRNLTRYTDRLVAIQGVASVLEKRLNDEYVYGIWKGDALWGLSWTTRVAKPCVPLDIAPTWSWASVYGRVNYGLWPERQWSFELVGFCFPDEDPGSRTAPSLPSVQLRGQLLEARLEVADADIASPLKLVIGINDPGMEPVTTTEVFLDTPCEGTLARLPDGGTIQTLNRLAVVARESDGERHSQMTSVSNTNGPITVWLLHLFSHKHHRQSEFIILGRSSSHIGKFQRIGTSETGKTVTTYNQVQRMLERSPDIEVSII